MPKLFHLPLRLAAIAVGVYFLFLSFGFPSGKAPIEINWVTIEGGAFQMGWPIEGGSTDGLSERSINVHIPEEQPKHAVHVPSFYIMRNEVTVAQYRQCVEAGACSKPKEDALATYYLKGKDRHPVNNIDWNQAKTFCTWAGGRLPTEAEWEYAARGQGREVMYPWGNEPPTCDRVVAEDEKLQCVPVHATDRVCSKPAGMTPQGLCDMAGNVWEWVEDNWHLGYADFDHGVKLSDPPLDGSAWLVSTVGTRVMRGGGIAATGDYRTTHRVAHPTVFSYGGLGVRCARSVQS